MGRRVCEEVDQVDAWGGDQALGSPVCAADRNVDQVGDWLGVIFR